jgi:hypothetical protein
VQEEENTRFGAPYFTIRSMRVTRELRLLWKYWMGFCTDSPTALKAAK